MRNLWLSYIVVGVGGRDEKYLDPNGGFVAEMSCTDDVVLRSLATICSIA